MEHSHVGGRSLRLPLDDLERDACGVGFVADISGHRSHTILRLALESVEHLTHRGAVDADGKSGDGAGVTTQIPRRLFAPDLERLGCRLPEDGSLAVGMVFFPSQPTAQGQAQTVIEGTLARYGLVRFGWRTVPVDPTALGVRAAQTQPDIRQVLVGRPDTMSEDHYRRALYLARKEIEARIRAAGIEDFYVPSFSNWTLVYKGLLVAPQLPKFYLDLQNPAYETALALFHQRYSTNTFPSWFLAQPFRTLAHNGEINTLQGNRNWIAAREYELACPAWGEQIGTLLPIIQAGGSDSANLDNVAELLMLSGRDLRQVMMLLIPEAWENMPNMAPDWRAFYEYHACLTEPWDGPAALAFTDGQMVGACLDRNGLRPARYKVLDNGVVIMASEVGVIATDDAHVVEKGRLGPGHMIAVDTVHHTLQHNAEIKEEVARRQPYGRWLQQHLFRLDDYVRTLDGHALLFEEHADVRVQKAFGFTLEEFNLVMKPMALEKKEPTWSMGDDTAVAPLAVLSVRPRPIYSYFKQKFAQVTNPPIDPLREELVTSLYTYLGRRGSLLDQDPAAARLVHLSSPFLLNHELEALRHLPDPAFAATTLSVLFHLTEGPEGLAATLERVCAEAEAAVDAGSAVLILSDRGVDPEHVAVPMLLAVGAVHHQLIRRGKRMRASIVAETGEAWEVHHFCALLGYGASAINPYLAFAIIRDMVDEEDNGGILDCDHAIANYKTAINKGILKVMSKMGISAVSGYQGAQIFEAIGLGDAVIGRCFAGTISWVSGIGLGELGQEAVLRHAQAFINPRARLDDVGYYRFRREGEFHAFNPFVVRALHKAIASGQQEDYDAYVRLTSRTELTNLRDLLGFKTGTPVPLDQVEPVESIIRHFTTGAMSLGALGPEAHHTFAQAMNFLGAKSNTGEGGEEHWRFQGRFGPRESLDNVNTAIKQVASGRFAVTPEYLAAAEELEIKMAQGSKPGEGGQLPGHKVVEHIAVIRHTIPGVTLISPPPHHDIYSIEDLAQLIYDLKQANPQVHVTVKLVSEAGVGTVAAGCVKAYADGVHVSGNEGGTGASPLSSIKNAGSPWELGLAETQQVLVRNGMRGRVKLRTDGGFRTGRDVVIAALLGADEYAFGTVAMVAIGCDMARQCHLNTCPTGIATQRADLRAKFTGSPEQVITFFHFVAQEVREILASLGARSLEQVIGRTDLLQQKDISGHPKANTLDLAAILADPDPSGTLPRRRMQDRNDRPEGVPLNRTILEAVRPTIETKGTIRLAYPITNVDRTVGAMVSGAIAYRYGDEGLPPGSIELAFEGSAGQSFGAFTIEGVRLILTGEANDYVGKGMHGGEIIVRPPVYAAYPAYENVIVGNTVLYGATGGYLFACGRAGERFAVRNSGAHAVVEGVGDHCCEYMTGGVVVVLGETGRNFGAGMAGGLAFVLDEGGTLARNYNPEMVTLEKVDHPEDIALLRSLIERHAAETGSARAGAVLAGWEAYLPRFLKVLPHPPVEPPGPRTPAAQAVPARG